MARTAPASLVVPKLQVLARQPVLTASDRGLQSIRSALASQYVQSGMELIDQWSDDPLMDLATDELYYTFPVRPSDNKSWEWELGVLAESTGGATVRIVAGGIAVSVVIPPGTTRAGGWVTDTDSGDHSGVVTSATVEFVAFVDCEVYGIFFRPTRTEVTLPAGYPSAYTNDVVPPDEDAYDGDSPLTPARYFELTSVAREQYSRVFGQAISVDLGESDQFDTIVLLEVPPDEYGREQELVVVTDSEDLVCSSPIASITGSGTLAVPGGYPEQEPITCEVSIRGEARRISAYWSERSAPDAPPGLLPDYLVDEFGDFAVDEFGEYVES